VCSGHFQKPFIKDSNSKGWVVLAVGGSNWRWCVSNRQVAGFKLSPSGRGFPLDMRSPKGVSPLKPSRSVKGG